MPSSPRNCQQDTDNVIRLVPRDPVAVTARLMEGHDPVFDLCSVVLGAELTDDRQLERCAVMLTLALEEAGLLDPILAAPTP